MLDSLYSVTYVQETTLLESSCYGKMWEKSQKEAETLNHTSFVGILHSLHSVADE